MIKFAGNCRGGYRVTIPYEALCRFRSRYVFNPWLQCDPLDLRESTAPAILGPAGRLARLKAHFAISPALVLIGEAAGYQGCHFSGIPFTNEKLLTEGRIPRIAAATRLTSRSRPWCEPSATIVWGALRALGLAERTILWNAFAWHPFKPGCSYSNRTPTRAELESGREVLDGVLAAFRCAAFVAVGKVAEHALRQMGRKVHATLRHPSMGGAQEFRAGLAALAWNLDGRAQRRRTRVPAIQGDAERP